MPTPFMCHDCDSPTMNDTGICDNCIEPTTADEFNREYLENKGDDIEYKFVSPHDPGDEHYPPIKQPRKHYEIDRKYSEDEIRIAVDIAVGDDGFRSKEVIEILKKGVT